MSKGTDILDGLWSAYRQDRSVTTRNVLVEQYLPVVDKVAKKVLRQATAACLDDLRSAGMLGLIEAVERFDPARGVRFSTYSTHRIRGAMVDELREIDWLPRSARARVKQSLDAASVLTANEGRTPTEDELTAVLKWKPGQYRSARHAGQVRFESLDAMRHSDAYDPDGVGVELIPDEREPDPYKTAADRDEVEHVLGLLPPRTRQVLRLRFLKGMKFKDVAQAMGMSQKCSAANAVTRAKQEVRERVAA